MEGVSSNEINKIDVYYIPYHSVFHNEKIRVVFNAATLAHNDLSLNSVFHIDQELQQDIASLKIGGVRVYLKWLSSFKNYFM